MSRAKELGEQRAATAATGGLSSTGMPALDSEDASIDVISGGGVFAEVSCVLNQALASASAEERQELLKRAKELAATSETMA